MNPIANCKVVPKGDQREGGGGGLRINLSYIIFLDCIVYSQFRIIFKRLFKNELIVFYFMLSHLLIRFGADYVCNCVSCSSLCDRINLLSSLRPCFFPCGNIRREKWRAADEKRETKNIYLVVPQRLNVSLILIDFLSPFVYAVEEER